MLLLVIAVLTSAAYREVRRASQMASTQRLVAVTSQLAAMLGKSSIQLADDALKMAADPALAALLRQPDTNQSRETMAALTGAVTRPDQLSAIEVWDAAGHRLGLTGPDAGQMDSAMTHRLIGSLDVRDSSYASPFMRLANNAAYAVVVRSKEVPGFVVHWRTFGSTEESRTQTQALIGTNSLLYLGNADGSLWSDLIDVVDGPPAAIQSEPVLEYTAADRSRKMGAARPIEGTPWTVAVSFPMSAIEEPAVSFLKYVLGIASLLLLLSVTAWWMVSSRISRPLVELTEAAESVAGSDFARRVDITRHDELGRLGIAFNEMVEGLRESRDRLEEKVAERTHALNESLDQLRAGEAKLQQAKEQAEQANHAKSDFLAKMSHELRTPLNSIIGFSEILEEQSFGPLNQRQGRYVENVLTSGRQLLELINDILDLSKIEAGHTELFVEKVDVAIAVEDAMTIVSPMAESKSITLHVTVHPDLPSIAADQVKLKQILCNLLSNAIKFTPDGGRVSVVARRCVDQAAGPSFVEIDVADTGIGIALEDQVRVFDEFEQVDSAHARAQKGTGLGLALTRRLVELHAGTITLQSELHSGSTFRFTLPVYSDESVNSDADVAVLSPARISAVDGPLVLVVEDDDRSRELLRHYLTADGYRVAEAATGDVAFTRALELMPDAITLDILLPGKLGHEILAELKADARTANIPVIVVSMTENRELGISLGAVDWLVKPTGRDDLIAAVRRVAATRGATEPTTVLVIDDEPQARGLLELLLTSQGFRVMLAEGGTAGIDDALRLTPDVVVVDLIMPPPDGFEVVRRIRQSRDGARFTIVVYSAKELTLEERHRLNGFVDG
ncbi:MAG: response regulator, partial [Gemmatimonadota bacterium]